MKSPELREERKEYKIREAVPADAAAISRIQYDSWMATYPNKEAKITPEDVRIYLGDPIEKEKKWEKTLSGLKKDEKVFVATDGEKVIGFCRIEKKENENYLNALYLDLAYQGKGVASKLMKQAFAYFGEDKPSMLEVAAYNDRAKEIYEHYGFQESERKIFPRGINGKEMELIVMRRPAKE
jgi:ribosomal protein S18 acetylase RimI-like enzyme